MVAAAGLGVVALLVVLAALRAGGPATPARSAADVTRHDLQAYVAAIKGPTAAGGEVVGAEMRPSLRAFTAGQVDGAVFADRARGWRLALQRAEALFRGVATPGGVAAARPVFDDAFQGYIAVAGLLESAAAAAEPARAQLIQQAVAAGEAADRTYDRAAAVVQAALRAAGLPEDADLPDTTPAPGG